MHGVYDAPDTVVLGNQSYEGIVRDTIFQDYLRSLVFSKTLLFIGAGQAGLSDPDFGGLIRWLTGQNGSSLIVRIFVLVLATEVPAWQQFLSDPRFQLVPYGASHDNLPGWLRAVADELAHSAHTSVAQGLRLQQPTFDAQLDLLESQLSQLGLPQFFHLVRQLVQGHQQALGVRSARMRFEHIYGKYAGGLGPVERVQYGLELADMMRVDGAELQATTILIGLRSVVDQGALSPDLVARYRRTLAAVLGLRGPYTDTFESYDRAITGEADAAQRAQLEAERDELRFLANEPESLGARPVGGGT
jgi:hypothetical protein